MTWEQDELIARLLRGELGPWGGQGFVPGGITILRPDTMQWETIKYVPGSAELTESTLGDPVEMGSTVEWANEVDLGLQVNLGLGSSVEASSGMPKVMASVIPATSYTAVDLPRTELGEIRMTHGISNGATGPLSPIRMGSQNAVDRDGNLWFPVVRMGGSGRSGDDRGGIGPR